MNWNRETGQSGGPRVGRFYTSSTSVTPYGPVVGGPADPRPPNTTPPAPTTAPLSADSSKKLFFAALVTLAVIVITIIVCDIVRLRRGKGTPTVVASTPVSTPTCASCGDVGHQATTSETPAGSFRASLQTGTERQFAPNAAAAMANVCRQKLASGTASDFASCFRELERQQGLSQ